MKLNIHQQASENFNSKIEELIMKLTSEHPLIEKMCESTTPNPDIHTVFHFDETNIIGEMKFGWTDNSGRVSAKAFNDGVKIVGLFDNDYKNLIRVAESFQKSINPKDKVSIELLENLLFDWIKYKSRNETELNLTEFVLDKCEKQIKEYEVWIPISLLYIQSAFVLGKITFRAITKSMIDDWETRLLSNAKNQKEIDSKKIYFERIRKDIQGLATATIKIEAEPIRAYEIAFEETERALSILRLFSPANFSPIKICYSAPWGKQHQDSDRFLLIENGKIVFHKSGFSDKIKPYWNISNEDLDRYIAAGLDVLNFLLNKENLTDLQAKYLETITIYSRSSLTKNLTDRVIFILVALETIFLKDTSEHIQEAVSLRMAYMQPVPVEERKAIRNNIRKIYGLRSSFIHHGKYISVDEMATLNEFVNNAYLSLLSLMDYVATEMTLQDYFDHLENRKLSG